MGELQEFTGNAQDTTLSGTLDTGGFSFTVDDATSWPTGDHGFFVVVIGADATGTEEKVKCLSRSGNTINVDPAGRGFDGTAPAHHDSGEKVRHVFDAAAAQLASDHVNDTTRDDHLQYLNTTRHSATSHAAVDHGTLQGLADDDHTQYALKSLWTGKGAILAGDAAGSPVALTVSGHDGRILTEDSTQSNGVAWKAATPSLIAYTSYTGAAGAHYTLNSTSITDVDATNLAVTFTAPNSGHVLVRLTGLLQVSSSGSIAVFWGLRDGTTTVGSPTTVYQGITESGGRTMLLSAPFVVTGLTAGSSYTWKWAYYLTSGVYLLFNGATSAGFISGPAVMEVWGAP